MSRRTKPCPHCHRKRRLSQKSATVAEFGDSRTFLRQSPFSATVWTGFNKGLRSRILLPSTSVADLTFWISQATLSAAVCPRRMTSKLRYQPHHIAISNWVLRSELDVMAASWHPRSRTVWSAADKGQTPLHQFPRSKSVTSWQLPRLREGYGETCDGFGA